MSVSDVSNSARCTSSIDTLAKALFLWSREDLRRDTWVSMEKYLLCDRSSSVSLLSSLTQAVTGNRRHSPACARTHTHTLQSNVTLSLVHQWGRAVRHTGLLAETRRLSLVPKLCIIHTGSLPQPCFDARCTTDWSWFCPHTAEEFTYLVSHAANQYCVRVWLFVVKLSPKHFRLLTKYKCCGQK